MEYPFPMIRQTSLGEAVKLDFAGGIRSLMRQDPDIILVGEIRDEATAEMAFRAAMTGHQVYSTLHTNSALGAIPRLLDIGLKPGILAGNIIGIIAQRLVRRLCPQLQGALRADRHRAAPDGHRARHAAHAAPGQGCERCNNTGLSRAAGDHGDRALRPRPRLRARRRPLARRAAHASRSPRASGRWPTTASAACSPATRAWRKSPAWLISPSALSG